MVNRRAFNSWLAATAAGPFVGRSANDRPEITHGTASGDVGEGSAVIWSRTDRPSRMIVEYATTDSFRDSRKVVGPSALPETDYAAKLVLTGLPPGQQVVYRVIFEDLAYPKARSFPAQGRFKTPPIEKADVSFAFGADTAGQGFGIDPARGGMKTYDSIRLARPDFFLNSGDTIYADNPIPAEVKLDDGSVWKNVVTEATSKVAETLDEFRGRYRYNLLDDNVRRLNSEVAILCQWDDHEVTNNWYPGERLEDARYKVKDVDLLAARARRAYLESLPIRQSGDDPERIYRSIKYGPSLEVFLLDQRSYRGANSPNRQDGLAGSSAFLGPDQSEWLVRALRASRSTWKVIASDMPIGLVVRDGPTDFEALANADDGPPLGREVETANLLRALKLGGVKNVVWLTGDVHYAAAHHYDPSRAKFTEFDPFWEFVAGPLHAGTFGPNPLDATFGPEVRFRSIPETLKPNRPPSEGLQFFGTARLDGRTEALTVSLCDRGGKPVYSVELAPMMM